MTVKFRFPQSAISAENLVARLSLRHQALLAILLTTIAITKMALGELLIRQIGPMDLAIHQERQTKIPLESEEIENLNIQTRFAY